MPTNNSLAVSDYKLIREGTLHGSFTLACGPVEVVGAMHFRSPEGKEWVSFPGIPRRDRDDAPLLDARGKRLYAPVCGWRSREQSARFQARILAMLAERFPEARAGA